MRFTDRQSQILELAAQGHGDKEIASRLGVSVHTVRTHLQRLYSAERLNNRAEAVAAWMAEQAAAPTPAEPPASPLRRPLRVMPAVAAVLVLATAAGGAFAAHALLTARNQAAACGTACDGPGDPGARPLTGAPAASATPGARTSATASAAKPAATPAPAGVPTPAPSVPPLPAQLPSPAVAVQAATGMLTLVNQDRSAAGLPPLAWNSCLAGVASQQAQRMATQGYVSSANGLVEDAACLVAVTPPGEDLGYWSGVNDAQLNTILMADPTERASLLGPFRYLGAAWGTGTNGVAYLAIELR